MDNQFDPNNQNMGDQNAAGQAGQQDDQQQAGQQAGQQGDQSGATQKKDLGGIMEENVDISSLVANAGNSQAQQQFMSSVTIPAHPNTQFDEQNFLQLLAGSISLTVNEKKRIITSIPKLSQFQVDELMKIFQEEKGKFAELEKKHADQVAELETQHAQGWQDVEAKAEEDKKREEEERQAEELKRSLGL